MHDPGDIQFAPLPPLRDPPTPEVPAWLRFLGKLLRAVGNFIEGIFAPLGKAIGLSWPVFQIVLIATAVILALAASWYLLRPLLETWRSRKPVEQMPDWAPDREDAIALLQEADRLASDGHYGEATHLLLRRSVHHIEQARPGLLQPASTAREIAGLRMLPERGRQAFAIIAGRVERGLFALRELDASDWAAARAAYADFTMVELRA